MKRAYRVALGGFLTMAVMASGRAEITLTDTQNRQATLEITEATPSEISYILQGRKGVLKLDQLTEASRNAAVEYAKSKNVYRSFPPLVVQVKIGYQRRNSAASSFKMDVKLNPSVVIQGVKQMGAIPAAEASLVLITHDTREKYVHHVEKMTVYATGSLPIPEAGSGARREFFFEPASMTFDTARDTTNIGGDEYKYFIFGLRDPVTKKLIDFQTNSVRVQSYVAKHPEARDALLAAGKGSPFSEEFPEK